MIFIVVIFMIMVLWLSHVRHEDYAYSNKKLKNYIMVVIIPAVIITGFFSIFILCNL